MTEIPLEPGSLKPDYLEAEPIGAPRVRWYDSTWRTEWLWIGFSSLVVWRTMVLLDWSSLPMFAAWLMYFALMFGVQGYFLLMPVMTRDQGLFSSLRLPTIGGLFREGSIAALVVVLALVVLWIAEIIVNHLFPGHSLGAQDFDDMARTAPPWFVLGMLVFAFTVPPIAEEVFFRGFLYSALRTRLPVVVAIFTQAGVFGAIHTFGVGHCFAAAFLGLVLALVYEWRKALLTPILVHAGLNFVASLGALYLMLEAGNVPVLGVLCEPEASGCVVRSVIPGSAADEVHVRPGDKITSLDQTSVASYEELVNAIRACRAGDEVMLTIERDHETLRLFVILRARSALPEP